MATNIGIRSLPSLVSVSLPARAPAPATSAAAVLASPVPAPPALPAPLVAAAAPADPAGHQRRPQFNEWQAARMRAFLVLLQDPAVRSFMYSTPDFDCYDTAGVFVYFLRADINPVDSYTPDMFFRCAYLLNLTQVHDIQSMSFLYHCDCQMNPFKIITFKYMSLLYFT